VAANELIVARRYRDAIPLLEQLTHEYPDTVEAWVNLGYALIQNGAPAAAETPLKTALNLDPDQARARLYLGSVRVHAGDRRGAIDCFRTALKRKPDYALAYFNLGVTLADDG